MVAKQMFLKKVTMLKIQPCVAPADLPLQELEHLEVLVAL